MPTFAEAPVYDANSDPYYGDQGQDLPPPPPPGGGDDGYAPAPASPTVPLSMEERLRRIEQQLNSAQGGGDAIARVESLQTQVQSLRAQVEDLSHQLQQVQTQQKSLYSDLDKRLSSNTSQAAPVSPAKKVEPASPSPKATSSVADTKTVQAVDQPNSAEEQQIYQTAYNLIKAKRYTDAIEALQGMLKKYPSGQFASNAHYWLGELYGLTGSTDQALTEFNTVVQNYPKSPRVSDAQLKVGLIQASESRWKDARYAFKKVVTKYPGTASARLAMEQLKQLQEAGH